MTTKFSKESSLLPEGSLQMILYLVYMIAGQEEGQSCVLWQSQWNVLVCLLAPDLLKRCQRKQIISFGTKKE